MLRRAWILGLVLSALLHVVVVLLLWRTELHPEADAPSAAHPEARGTSRELALYSIRPVEEAELVEPIPTPPPPEDVATPPTAPTPDAQAGEPGAESGADQGVESAVDMLRPRMADPRLWQRVQPPPERQLSDVERARIRLYSRLGALNDSLALVAESQRRATDWTIEDENGGRWGISPGKLHLGDRTIPLPFGFSPPPGQREEMADRRFKDGEIQRQAERHDAERSRQDEAGAIRDRRDGERRQSSGTSSDSGSGTGSSSGSGGGGDGGA